MYLCRPFDETLPVSVASFGFFLFHGEIVLSFFETWGPRPNDMAASVRIDGIVLDLDSVSAVDNAWRLGLR